MSLALNPGTISADTGRDMARLTRPASISPDPASRVDARLWELAPPQPAVVERLHSTGAWSVWQADAKPPVPPPSDGGRD